MDSCKRLRIMKGMEAIGLGKLINILLNIICIIIKSTNFKNYFVIIMFLF